MVHSATARWAYEKEDAWRTYDTDGNIQCWVDVRGSLDMVLQVNVSPGGKMV